MEDHRTWPNSLLFWTLETKCEHESMGVTVQPIVQSPHNDQHVQVAGNHFPTITPSHRRSLPGGELTGRHSSMVRQVTGLSRAYKSIWKATVPSANCNFERPFALQKNIWGQSRGKMCLAELA